MLDRTSKNTVKYQLSSAHRCATRIAGGSPVVRDPHSRRLAGGAHSIAGGSPVVLTIADGAHTCATRIAGGSPPKRASTNKSEIGE